MWVFRTQELLIKLSKHWRVPHRPCPVLAGQKMQALSPGSLSSGCGRMQVLHRKVFVIRSAASFATEELCDLGQVTVSL